MKNQSKIVVVGGGTGLSILLSGLKNYTKNITAIVTVADDGGGSGRLREDLGMLPPGDIRACILSLSNAKESMQKLFGYRFINGMLKGQSFGNLLIAAMNEIYGDFGIAVKETSRVLNITGEVLPVTLEKMDLVAELENGKKFLGESAIPKFVIKEKSKIKRMYLENSEVAVLGDCIEAIKKADLIVLGPGSLYTSVIPNLLLEELSENIKKAKAKTVYICNLMTQPGETDEYGVKEHVDAIILHGGTGILDYCIANEELLDEKIRRKYLIQDSMQILPNEIDERELKEKGIELLTGNFLDVKSDYVRHNSDKLSKKIMEILNR